MIKFNLKRRGVSECLHAFNQGFKTGDNNYLHIELRRDYLKGCWFCVIGERYRTLYRLTSDSLPRLIKEVSDLGSCKFRQDKTRLPNFEVIVSDVDIAKSVSVVDTRK